MKEAACILLLVATAAVSAAAGWEGWVYLGDDGPDDVFLGLDIREHGYKIENGLWMFKFYLAGEPEGENLVGPAGPAGIYLVNIDTRGDGSSDYCLHYDGCGDPIVRERLENGSWIYYFQPYWEINSEENYIVFSISVDSLDLQKPYVTFWWETWYYDQDNWIIALVDDAGPYQISSSEVPAGTSGLITLSVLLAVFLIVCAKFAGRRNRTA